MRGRNQESLEENDVPQLRAHLGCRRNGHILEKFWQEELQKPSPYLPRAVFRYGQRRPSTPLAACLSALSRPTSFGGAHALLRAKDACAEHYPRPPLTTADQQ